jgi:diguanylate cyclase (GGDEF)-like protein
MKAKNFFPTVGEIAHMGVVQATGRDTIVEAVGLMEASNLSDVVFECDGGHAIFTVEDLMQFRQHKRDYALRLDEIAVPRLNYVRAAENVLNVLPVFDAHQCRYLGVRDDSGRLIGVVSYTDVLASVDPVVVMERKKLIEVVSKRHIEVVPASMSVEQAMMHLIYAEDAVLVEQDGNIAGIVTTKDAIRLIKEQVDTDAPIGRYMTSPVWTISQGETIKSAIDALRQRQYKRAIVTDEQGKLVGVVTQRELIDLTYGRWAELMKLHAHELGELVHVLESKNYALQQETLTDTLTGAGNRRKINQAIEAEIGRYYRHGMTPFSVMLLDIDFFKKVNDMHGHLFGDKVLRHVAQHVSGMLRITDVLARWGGEEFAVLLPTANREAAAILAERIREVIASSPFDKVSVTVSIGVAEYARGEALEGVLRRADQALYAAKEGGRNRVVSSSDHIGR